MASTVFAESYTRRDSGSLGRLARTVGIRSPRIRQDQEPAAAKSKLFPRNPAQIGVNRQTLRERVCGVRGADSRVGQIVRVKQPLWSD